tara:strand:+ start:1214 stop:2242 length:1029 start_codon:yes stop_codon:yes gene_type:complete
MLFYYLIYFLLVYLSYYKFKQEKIIIYGVGLFLILVAGFRGDIAMDYTVYEDYYRSIINTGFIDVEYSFRLITYAVHYLFNNVIYLFVIYSIIGVTVKFYALKRITEFFFLSVLIYFSHYFILGDMVQIRIGASYGFILWSIIYIKDKELIKFLSVSLFAIFFHYSTIIVLPFYFINSKKMQNIYFFLIPICYILYFVNVSIIDVLEFVDFEIISKKYMKYKLKASVEDINVFNVWQLGRILLCGLFLWKWKLIRDKTEYGVIMIKFYILSCFFLVSLSKFPTFGFRVSDIFGIVEIIIIPYILYLFKKEQKPIINIIIYFIGFIFLSITIFYNHNLQPYFK